VARRGAGAVPAIIVGSVPTAAVIVASAASAAAFTPVGFRVCTGAGGGGGGEGGGGGGPGGAGEVGVPLRGKREAADPGRQGLFQTWTEGRKDNKIKQ
jgi:hypothetical protein